MLATIGLDALDKATRTRSIGIRMQRKKREDQISKFRRFDGSEIQRRCMRWVADNLPALEAVGPMDINECSTDRQEDVWEPLVAIASVAGGDWEKRIRGAASYLSGGANKAATEAIGHQLLSAIRDFFAVKGDKSATKALIEWLDDSGEFSDFNQGRGITPHFLAKHLKPYGVEPRDLRIDGAVLKGYDLAGFEDAFQTYLVSPAAEIGVSKGNTATMPVNSDKNPLFEKATDSNCSVSENAKNINKIKGCSGVADSNPDNSLDKEEAMLL